MVAQASIWLLDTAGVPASAAADSDGMGTLGGILAALVVVTMTCLFTIGYREWRAGRTQAGGRGLRGCQAAPLLEVRAAAV